MGMMRAPTSCAEPCCGKPSQRGSRFCPLHVESNSFKTNRNWAQRHDEVSKRYHRQPWISFRVAMLTQNPICQKIIDGEQCHAPARLVHHLWSPRVRPDLFVEPKNVLCLCERCHPSDEGTPFWRVGVDYIATEFRNPIIGVQP